MAKTRLYVGTSGFSYKDWTGAFYPADLTKSEHLAYYANLFDTVELNTTFYHLASKQAFQNWHRKTPADFAFAIKGSRFITHIKKLRDPKEPLALFFENAKFLKEKLKVVLWQFSPNFHYKPGAFEAFIPHLRRISRIRQAFEFRHESWLDPRVVKMLSDENMAVCMPDWPIFSQPVPITADFVYLRRHGTDKINRYKGAYSQAALKKDARDLRAWAARGMDAFLYFNNDYEAHAAHDALAVKKNL